jgi:hypothetical protein
LREAADEAIARFPAEEEAPRTPAEADAGDAGPPTEALPPVEQ